jgi:hypothetical protein
MEMHSMLSYNVQLFFPHIFKAGVFGFLFCSLELGIYLVLGWFEFEFSRGSIFGLFKER